MSLVGNLFEFPLPEVLLLIGNRTGRLRLYNATAPEVLPIEMDVSAGFAHGLHIADEFVTDTQQIVAELSFLIETGEGMFEFSSQPIVSVQRDEPLLISELVMLLVLHVDEKLARQRALLAPQVFYILESPPPTIAMTPDLNLFYLQSRQLLAEGIRSEDLAEYLGLQEGIVQPHLDSLHQLGFVKLLETSDVETLRASLLQKEISQKSTEFQLAVEASELIRRSGKLLKLPVQK